MEDTSRIHKKTKITLDDTGDKHVYPNDSVLPPLTHINVRVILSEKNQPLLIMACAFPVLFLLIQMGGRMQGWVGGEIRDNIF